MNISVTNQVYVFIMSAVGGALVGAVFDVFRAIRKKIRQGAVAVGVQDILFWLIASFIVFMFMYNYNNGEPRWFVFGGALTGAVLYYGTFGHVMVNVFVYIGTAFAFVIGYGLKIILLPVALIFKIFKKPMLIITLHARGIMKRLRGILMKLIKAPKKLKKRLKMY